MDNGACVDNGKWILQAKDMTPNSFDTIDDGWKVAGA